jgi:hypothetical protein
MKKMFLFRALLPLMVFAVCSCSTETALQKIFGVNSTAPVFYGCRIAPDGSVEFRFSVPVTVSSMYFDPPLEAESYSEGETVIIRIPASFPGGTQLTADILVEDTKKNTLNIMVPFRTRNNRLPGLVINEIRSAYSKPKVEFIEFRTTSAGNLGALRVFAAYEKGAESIFVFPPVEVKTGEYIVLHTRSIEAGLVDETGANLAASAGTDALAAARDFWIPGSQILHGTNAIYVMDQDDKIIDGVLLKTEKYAWKEEVATAAKIMVSQGAWKAAKELPGPEDAVNTSNATATRTINRSGSADSNSAADWYITVTSGATPGKVNNPGRYK